MELVNLNKAPMAATMLGKGDKIFYKEEEESGMVKVEIAEETYLEFDKKPTYSVRFLSDSKYHRKGQIVHDTDRSQLYMEMGLAKSLADDFFMMAFD